LGGDFNIGELPFDPLELFDFVICSSESRNDSEDAEFEAVSNIKKGSSWDTAAAGLFGVALGLFISTLKNITIDTHIKSAIQNKRIACMKKKLSNSSIKVHQSDSPIDFSNWQSPFHINNIMTEAKHQLTNKSKNIFIRMHKSTLHCIL